MDISPVTARRISVFAWVMAAVGTVVGQLHALARALSHPSDWEEGGLGPVWGPPAADLLRPLLDWSDPWTVYVTYGKIWTPVCIALVLAAWLVYCRRQPRGLERRLWQLTLGAYALMTLSVIGDYFTPQWMDVAFVIGLGAMLVIGLGGFAFGVSLWRNGFRPRITAVLVFAFLPLFFVITQVTSMGSSLLPLSWGWALAAHAVVRADRSATGTRGASPVEARRAEASVSDAGWMRRIPAVAGIAGALFLVGPAPANAERAPAQRFDIGFRFVDGELARMSMVASGTATGRGTVSEDYSQGPDGTWYAVATFTLPGGSVIASAETGQLERVFRPQACQASGRMHIPYTVVGGTGAYAGATGAGWLIEHQNLVGGRVRGECQGPDSGLSPALVVGRIVAEGTLVLP